MSEIRGDHRPRAQLDVGGDGHAALQIQAPIAEFNLLLLQRHHPRESGHAVVLIGRQGIGSHRCERPLDVTKFTCREGIYAHRHGETWANEADVTVADLYRGLQLVAGHDFEQDLICRYHAGAAGFEVEHLATDWGIHGR